jgi:hypothetical protein
MVIVRFVCERWLKGELHCEHRCRSYERYVTVARCRCHEKRRRLDSLVALREPFCSFRSHR